MTSQAKIPAHVAIIMDGNGRWAQAQSKERNYGHENGIGSIKACIRGARRTGVRYVTFYAFSTENWGRPAEEVNALMELLCLSVIAESEELRNEGVKVITIGCRSRLSQKVNAHLDQIERETAAGDKLTAILAINYSSRSEITRAAVNVAKKVLAGTISPQDITGTTLEQELYTAAIPDPDLLIRTGGEQRLSNFLLWQAAYAELYFTPVMWPDFNEDRFIESIAEFGQRQRKFGLITDQI